MSAPAQTSAIDAATQKLFDADAAVIRAAVDAGLHPEQLAVLRKIQGDRCSDRVQQATAASSANNSQCIYALYSDLEMRLINAVYPQLMRASSASLASMPDFTVSNQLAIFPAAFKARNLEPFVIPEVKIQAGHTSFTSVFKRALVRLEKEIGYKYPTVFNDHVDSISESFRKETGTVEFRANNTIEFMELRPPYYPDESKMIYLKEEVFAPQLYTNICKIKWTPTDNIVNGKDGQRAGYYCNIINRMISFVLAELCVQEFMNYHPPLFSAFKPYKPSVRKETPMQFAERRDILECGLRPVEKSAIMQNVDHIDENKLAAGIASLDMKLAAFKEDVHTIVPVHEVTDDTAAELALIRKQKAEEHAKKEAAAKIAKAKKAEEVKKAAKKK